jgi:hypothetical protein
LNLTESSDDRSSISSNLTNNNINNSHNNDDLMTKIPTKTTTSKLNSILKTTMNKSLTNLKFNQSDTNQENLINFDDKPSNNKPHHSSTSKLNKPQFMLTNNEEFFITNNKKCENCKCQNETRLKSLNNNNNNYSKMPINLNTSESKKIDVMLLDLSSVSSSPASKISNHYQNVRIKKYIEDDEEDSEDNDMRRELDNYKLILSDDTSRTLTDINDTLSKLDTTDSSDDLDLFIKNLEVRNKNGVKITNSQNNKNEVFTETQI